MNESASPWPVTIAGKDLHIKPLTEGQLFGALSNWMRSSFLRTTRESLEKETDPAVRDKAMKDARVEAEGIEWAHPIGQKLMERRDGQVQLLYQSLLTTTPGITREKCFQMMKKSEDRDAFFEAFDQVNDIGGLKKKETEEQ